VPFKVDFVGVTPQNFVHINAGCAVQSGQAVPMASEYDAGTALILPSTSFAIDMKAVAFHGA
jgi:hypothetical protein